MSREVYRYRFDKEVPANDLEESLLLAVLAIQCLHGESRARLDARYCLNAGDRTCVIDASNDIGRDLNRVFTGFVSREFGDGSFKVDHVDAADAAITTDQGDPT